MARTSLSRTAQTQGFRVQFARTEKDRIAIRNFRYRVFCEEMGRDAPDVNHAAQEISNPLDESAVLIMLKQDDELVATARLNRGSNKGTFPRDFSESFRLEKFLEGFGVKALSMSSGILILKDYAGTQAMALMLAAIYKLCRQQNSRFDFISCDPFMVKAYERLGYRRYTGNFVDASMGYQVPMVLLIEDLEHLQTVESPFARIAAHFPPDKDTRHWFAREFTEYANRPIEQTMTEEEYWQYLTEKMQQTPLVGIPLLKGLTFREAKKFVNSGTVITCDEGDTIIRRGENGDCMFVILAGKVEVRSAIEEGGFSFSTLKGGDIFGELGFLRDKPRTADVIAVEPTEVLLLTQKFFRNVMEKIPRIAMQVLFNMCIVLAERLHTSTEDLIAALGNGQIPNDLDPTDTMSATTKAFMLDETTLTDDDDFIADSLGSNRYGSGDW